MTFDKAGSRRRAQREANVRASVKKNWVDQEGMDTNRMADKEKKLEYSINMGQT